MNNRYDPGPAARGLMTLVFGWAIGLVSGNLVLARMWLFVPLVALAMAAALRLPKNGALAVGRLGRTELASYVGTALILIAFAAVYCGPAFAGWSIAETTIAGVFLSAASALILAGNDRPEVSRNAGQRLDRAMYLTIWTCAFGACAMASVFFLASSIATHSVASIIATLLTALVAISFWVLRRQRETWVRLFSGLGGIIIGASGLLRWSVAGHLTSASAFLLLVGLAAILGTVGAPALRRADAGAMSRERTQLLQRIAIFSMASFFFTLSIIAFSAGRSLLGLAAAFGGASLSVAAAGRPRQSLPALAIFLLACGSTLWGVATCLGEMRTLASPAIYRGNPNFDASMASALFTLSICAFAAVLWACAGALRPLGASLARVWARLVEPYGGPPNAS